MIGSSLRTGTAYFVAVFAVGFVLGTLRVLALEPRLGSLASVALELPVMLVASWWICGVVIRRLEVPKRWPARARMGGLAFILLISAEFLLAALFGTTPADRVRSWATAAGALGLAGQMTFAAIPLIR